MDALAAKRIKRIAQHPERDFFRVHQRQKLLQLQRRWSEIDERARRIDDITRCEQNFAAVSFDNAELFARARMQLAAGIVFVALGEIVGLDDAQVFERRRILVDGDVVDHVECGEI